ncbi:MAG: S-layer homology domain-containing protein [Clostridia bacterium]|nr:S-layer homology domain-containing protein [Clostridia bacterium]
MKRRILALIVAAVLALPGFAVYAAEFSDLGSSHWAYSSVSKLVDEGTINGFTDGTFRPDATVSRAEFVKMIGKGPVAASETYTDVAPGAWYYDYVMYSGLAPLGSRRFEPDTPITRGDVAGLLWKRNGSVKVDGVPAMITSQSSEPDAIAWVYAKGIMMGDDYINLRLGDSLTRAEAAALIVRARENTAAANVNFIDYLDDKVLETVYNSLNLFDNKPYNPDAKVTNGELAHMAIRLAEGQNTVTYGNFSCEIPFEHKYAQSLDAYAKYCIGEDKITQEYIDKNATVSDAVCAITFGLLRTSVKYIEYGDTDNYYKDITAALSEKANKHLTAAYKAGISIYADGNIKADKDVTLKELAALLFQADSISGFNRANIFAERKSFDNYPINTDITSYPSNADEYAVILKGIPKDVYEAEYVVYADGESIGSPKSMYNSARDFNEIYNDMLLTITETLWANNEKLSITYYPSMVVNNGDGCTYRVKIDVVDVSDGMTLGKLIPIGTDVNDVTLKDGMTVYADLETGAKLTGIFYAADTAGINQVVKVVE